MASTDSITVPLNVKFEGVKDKEQPPATTVYAFDATGQLIASGPVENSKAALPLPAQFAGQTVRFFAGPRVDSPNIARLSQMRAVEIRQRIDVKNPAIDWIIVDPDWRPWLLCSCVVRGRLVKRLTLPDGTTKELPICHSRVTICEVFEIPRFIYRLPEHLVRRLRDEFIAVVKPPFPPPPPGDPFRVTPGVAINPVLTGSPAVAASPAVNVSQARRVTPGVERANTQSAAQDTAQPMALQLTDPVMQHKVRALSVTTSVEEIRKGLVDISSILIPYFCWWPWLESYLILNCIRTVYVDENGHFQATIHYPCVLGPPNLYFKAEQHHGFIWQWIYRPSVYCNTYWNYACGSEVVIHVTDPSAIPCAPGDPVDPPPGVTTWVMPFAVGGTKIWGTPPLAPPAPAGWVRFDGLTDYGGFVDAPFGSFLGFRHGSSINIPSAAIKYYRWRYRKAATVDWFDMHEPVIRHYVHQTPAALPTFPVYPLGPHTVGLNANLFEFKPPAPPGPGVGDPPGTITYWPTDDFFADIYTGYLDTPALPPNIAGAAGQYQIKLEIFDSAGNLVMPGPGTFHFIVPSGVAGDGVTVLARNTAAAEIDAGGFIFNLHIDNNECTALIDAPHIGMVATADDCGFLRYNPMDATPVSIGFHAQHPNHFATFSFTMVRGAIYLPGASASGEVAALAAGAYAGDGNGNFSHAFPRGDLLGSCVNAAFAEDVNVYAKATTGWGSNISSYDASALRAFALAPIP